MLGRQMHIFPFMQMHYPALGTQARALKLTPILQSQLKSMQLANNVQSELIKATGLRNRGVKTANFHVHQGIAHASYTR